MPPSLQPYAPACNPMPPSLQPLCTQVAIFHDFLTPSHIAQLRADVSEAERAAGVDTHHGTHDGTKDGTNDGTHHGAHHGTHNGTTHGANLGARLGGGGAGAGLRFVPIDNETFSLPPSLAHMRDQIPPSIRGYGMGYRHMCRFFSAAVFSHAALLDALVGAAPSRLSTPAITALTLDPRVEAPTEKQKV
mgnify:CR=1 FL=1